MTDSLIFDVAVMEVVARVLSGVCKFMLALFLDLDATRFSATTFNGNPEKLMPSCF